MGTRVVTLTLWLLGFTVSAAPVTFDGGVTYQVIDGFGVNANHRSWHNDELKPVLDAFIDQAGMTLFRVVFDQADWETNNDNGDPAVMDWGYYGPVYGSARFTPLWEMFGYLNQRGITDGAFLNFMGHGPGWIANNGAALTPGMEGEWAEMITSLLMYARFTNGLQFKYVAPDNEPDLYAEGVEIQDAGQYVLALHELAVRLATNGLADVRIIGPDRSDYTTTFMPEMMADPVVMDQLGRFSAHVYGAASPTPIYDFIQSSPYPDRNLWVTEFNVWCPVCDSGTRGTYDWAYCEGTAEYLMEQLLGGASGALVWEGYDSFYLHGADTWSYWGLFSVDDENAAVKTYTARKNFYTVAQVSKWVRPGARRIGVSGSVSSLSPLLAFKHDGLGQITIVGINASGSAVTLSGMLASLPAMSQLDLYYTSATTNLAYGGSVTVNNGSFEAVIPADCVFTLTGISGMNVLLTSPVNGAQFNAPATIPLAATASSTMGGISLVEFYNGATRLGEAAAAPYAFSWNDVPMGNYALKAVAGDTQGNSATSAVVNVTVVGSLAQIGVTPANATVHPGWKQQFEAAGLDLLGHAVVPQPAFVWSVTGGGTIDATGLFTAGGVTGGPFDVVATSGAYTGRTSVNVVAVGGGTIGNTMEGASRDTMWSGGAWINACRFQAASNMVVSSMSAKVGAISGRYQCAIYADDGGKAATLLCGTAEVRNASDGWNVFPLTSPVTLTNGQYYWLAIWSDDPDAAVYCTEDSGTLSWGRYNYGAWPNPIITSGGNHLNYCIFAAGADVVIRRPLKLSGAVTYYPNTYPSSGLPREVVGGVAMGLTGDASRSVTTLADGTYDLGEVSSGGTYCITPSKTDDSAPANGITVADLAIMQARILGKLSVGPYQLLAADVSTNGSVSVADLALIQAVILGKLNNFPAGLWRFVPADYIFPDPVNPWSAPSQVWYTNQVTDITNMEFLAIKLGDVNGSWKAPANGLNLAFDRGSKESSLGAAVPEVGFGVGQQSAAPGQAVTVEVAASGFHRVTSAQFSLEWDPGVLRYLGTGRYGVRGLSPSCFGTTMTANGKLAFGWYDPEATGVTLADGTVLLEVSFEVIGKPGSVSAVRLTDAPTPQEVSVDFALVSFRAKDGGVAVVGPGLPGKQPHYAVGVFQLSVSTQTGRSYTLEFTDALAPANWKALPPVVGDGTVSVLTDWAATNQQRFYRVRVD
jgi:O-glycosyl hydrolase